MATVERTPNSKRAINGTFIYSVLVGLALLALGWGAILKNAAPAATTAFILGGGSLLIAPFVSRLEGRLKIGPVELTLRQQVIKAVESANEESLEGVLPLLTSGEVSVVRLRLPGRFAERRLIDPELSFLRQRLHVSVLGVLQPGEEGWRAGGAISDLQLHEGAELLVAGAPDTLVYLRFLVASDNAELWQRVT
jgi:hypothetical protein